MRAAYKARDQSEAPTIESAPLSVSTPRGTTSLDDYLREIECSEIRAALSASRNNVAEAARILGIPYRSLRYRLENLGIE
ncbi:MAG: hypothetical protein HZT41_07345 [Dechloromonas sp.]|nr:MAG: hypothetical protein HZT41_07345 [Dechloromonas sp.]